MMKHMTTLLLLLFLLAPAAHSKVSVITSTADLAWFAKQIGGEEVSVDNIASPTADIHFVEIRPSFMVKVARADLALKVGLELDMWMDRIIDGSRNSDLVIVDCSRYIEPLEVPTFKADARYGDLHRFGNPHYWLGPQNLEPITQAIVEGLSEAAPEHADQFAANRDRLLDEINRGLEALQGKLERLDGVQAIFYHNSWPYFNEYTGIEAVEFIEPYPGVPPSPSHVKKLIDLVAEREIPVIGIEPYFDPRVPNKVASKSNATVVTLYPSIGGRNSDESYLEWFEGNVDALLEALR
ncbi:hypothetical protein GF420_15525 [candidate division GN15 bacterium]|nr:hypothetical protein [candidate division GN15 bacterium]